MWVLRTLANNCGQIERWGSKLETRNEVWEGKCHLNIEEEESKPREQRRPTPTYAISFTSQSLFHRDLKHAHSHTHKLVLFLPLLKLCFTAWSLSLSLSSIFSLVYLWKREWRRSVGRSADQARPSSMLLLPLFLPHAAIGANAGIHMDGGSVLFTTLTHLNSTLVESARQFCTA